MEKPDEGYPWEELIEKIKIFANNALALTSSLELDGKDGISEMGLKLVMLSYLTTQRDEYEIESERTVEGGRMDLFLRHKDSSNVLVIELKYLRVGFLDSCKVSSTISHTKRYAKYNEVDRDISQMEYKDLLGITNRRYNDGKLSTETLSSIIDAAHEQNKRYGKGLFACSSIRKPLEKNTCIHTVVIVGIGRNVISAKYCKFTK